jgi:restriction endonuclease Mrr
LALPSGAFEHLMARLLEAIGYREVRVLAGSQGGADLCASASQGFSRPVTLVQAKQYRLPVSRRFVDELRGAMLRHHAPHGVLLTTSTFYLPAYRAAGQPGPLPVRLVDGAELLDLLVAHKLGVGVSGTGRPRLDRAYFERLRREHGSLPRVGRPRLGPTRNA